MSEVETKISRNKRVSTGLIDKENVYRIKFKRLLSKEEQEMSHTDHPTQFSLKNKIQVTNLFLTREALIALQKLLNHIIKCK